ncbi:beta-L-arabinofuranosidase domain-containing protein [Oligosphaera ethanolica]|uniref:DUF1680 family protein n=1 Tax=Oligosphaera ethanolica TaxID=760260 RepID=A0AAE4AN89_9BACT|nr:beta-L-arabinofuranosidase domain-containing protein [Oligosphaera ethanolica]MDQ0290079.1 DUF1680 family protein [Oligosphaera ethanolica]
MAEYAVSNLLTPLSLKQTLIAGPIGELMENFFEQRIRSRHGREVVYQEAEDAFKNQLDDESGVVGIWQGEFWGKWMISAARVCEYEDDAALREFIRQAAHRLMAYQRADGYIGTYKNSLLVIAPSREEGKKVMGWGCNWNWNIWCRKYTLWGLLEAHRLLNDASILQAAIRLADHLIVELRDNGIWIGDTGTFLGMPSCSILKPMLQLYRVTDDRRYLDFASAIIASWNDPSGKAPNLIANGLSGKPVHEWYPRPPEWAKVYEMLSCLDGILEYHRVTGDQSCLEAVEKAHAAMWEHEQNQMFSVGYNDIFNHAARQINAISEPCDAIHFMRVTYELFALTGKRHYMDVFELTYLNAFLAGVYRDGMWGSRGVRSSARHMTVAEQAKLQHNHCCVNNMPRGFMNAAQAAVMKSADAIVVNLYTDAQASVDIAGGTVSVVIGGSYLLDGRAQIDFSSTAPTPVKLRLRVPAWSHASAMQSDGQAIDISGKDYAEATLPAAGKLQLQLHFHAKPQIRHFAHPVAALDKSDWYAVRWVNAGVSIGEVPFEKMISEPRCTLQYGPLLLARSKFIGNSEKEMFDAESIAKGDFRCTLTPAQDGHVRCAFDAEFVGAGRRFRTRVCDYASAGNQVVADTAFFSIFF